MGQLAFWLGIFGLAALYSSIGISDAGESHARMLRSWRRLGLGLLAAAAIALAISVLEAR